MTPQTADERAVLDLTPEELEKIADTLRNLKNNKFSLPIPEIKLTYPQKTSTVIAWNPATRDRSDVKMATFYMAGQGGGALAETLQLAVRYLDLLPVAVAMLRRETSLKAERAELEAQQTRVKHAENILGPRGTTSKS
jgi:hypothetical protein